MFVCLQAYRAAMQTQWNWILQLCSCVEQHLKENAVYFEVGHRPPPPSVRLHPSPSVARGPLTSS